MRNKVFKVNRQELPTRDSVKRNEDHLLECMHGISTSLQTNVFKTILGNFLRPAPLKKSQILPMKTLANCS